MSDEFKKLGDDVTDSVSKFASAPRIKAAWEAASTPAKIAGGLTIAGLLIAKPLLLAAAAAVVYSGVKGKEAYDDYTPPAEQPKADKFEL
ncbi:MAG: hypothetical protein H6869_09235 [Rhodospirillales bacterium]|nr:hypothetical protein [Rhodospirillales bacterium]